MCLNLEGAGQSVGPRGVESAGHGRAIKSMLAMTYEASPRGCKRLQPVARTLILTVSASGITVDAVALYTRQYYCSVTGNSVKNTLMLAAVLVGLSLPTWASEPRGWYPPPPPPTTKPHTAVPEGGNWPAYTIVSGAVLLGGLLLARKQRETGTVADRS